MFLKKINGFNYPAEKLFIKIEFESFGKKDNLKAFKKMKRFIKYLVFPLPGLTR